MSQAERTRSAAFGYAMVSGSFLLVGLSDTLVKWATAPPGLLLVLRFGIAAVAIGVALGRRRRLVCLLDCGLWPRLLVMGAFFFIQPVWIALLAPRLLHSPTERVVYVAIGLALAGLAIILVPALSGDGLHASVLGLVAGLLSGFSYAGFALVVKYLSGRVDSGTMVLSECTLDCLFLLPLALWQTLGAGYSLTGRDLLVALVLGLVCTALAYTLWMEGVRWVRMQHSAVLGFLAPVAAPIYALLLLGQSITVWTAAGGALILIAGILVVLRGQEDLDSEVPL